MSVRIQARPRGPLVVETEDAVEVVGTDGQKRDTTGMKRLLFCRCGASRTSPFCDGSHNRTRFESDPPDE